jgi:DNA-binding phage protein
VSTAPTRYWDDLVEDLKDPEFLRSYITESLRVATIDQLVNDLDEARNSLGLSKAELARAISAEPAVIRRLLSPGHRNPTIGTLAEVAAALGLKVALVPMTDEEREQVAEPLRSGTAKNPEEVVRKFAMASAS